MRKNLSILLVVIMIITTFAGAFAQTAEVEQPVLGNRVKDIIEVDGLQFKDLNGDGELTPYEDWRLSAEERADNLVSLMTIDEKIGQMVINSRPMGIFQTDRNLTSHGGVLDESESNADRSIFGEAVKLGSTSSIVDYHIRHFILRTNPKPAQLAIWINTLNEVAEGTRLGIPVIMDSNSRNENAVSAFGFNEASGVFSTWPGTLGLAAAAKGDIKAGGDASLITQFAEIARSEWDASGMKKGYMYMADVMTDPRWQRTYGTLGEDPEFIADAIRRLVLGFQGEQLGPDSVALTVKHFPGGGARENGFDPHYVEGQYNVYVTPGSLEKYHMPPFEAAVEAGTSSIMPYYSIPSNEKSAPQEYRGEVLDFSEQVGFAFNKVFIQDVLRGTLGFKGYINSDSGITKRMAWGVSDLSIPERNAYAINNGVDIISDTNEVWEIKAAFDDGLIEEAQIDTAAKRLLKEMFELGLFENPYRDPENAEKVVGNPENWAAAYEGHQKSVVLLKNTDGVLPLTADKLEGKKVYIQAFSVNAGEGETLTEQYRKNLDGKDGIVLTDDYNEADYAILLLSPKSGAYFSATKGYLELDIVENKEIMGLDGEPYTETTLIGADEYKTVAEAVRANGGKVITNVNVVMAWILGNVEPYADALLAGFDTFPAATLDVILGKYNPTGVLPITLPASEDVVAVDENGICVSPNDVPGYDKDLYMPEGMKYAYVDADGNEYRLDFGLSY